MEEKVIRMPRRTIPKSEVELWEPFNASYGPWYRAYFKRGGRSLTAILQPDMDKEKGWFWSVRYAPYHPKPSTVAKNPKVQDLPEKKLGGRVKTLQEAKDAVYNITGQERTE